MKKISKVLFLLLVLATSACSGDKELSQPPEKTNANEFPSFNVKTVVKIKGQVVRVLKDHYLDRPGYDVGIIVRTEEGDIPVQLGPGWYVEGPVQLQRLDEVEVKGSRLYSGGQLFIVASEVKLGNHILKLRDDKGNPLWSGWERR